jgi:ferritin-like protein
MNTSPRLPDAQLAPPPAPRASRPKYPSDRTRSIRRRQQRATDEEQLQAINYAQQLQILCDKAPDEQTRLELRQVINSIRLRYTRDEHRQRLAVLKALEQSARLTLAEIVEMTRLSEELVKEILDDFSSPETELVELTTGHGKQKCGRGGTIIYYGLTRRHMP